MAKSGKKTKNTYSAQKKTIKKKHNARFAATIKRKYRLCRSQFVSSTILKKHLAQLEYPRYKKTIQKVYETYSKSLRGKYVYQDDAYTIEKYNILDRLPDIPAVKTLRNKSNRDITRKDIETILNSPNISANNLIFSKFSNIDIIMDLIKNILSKV